ncbi:unnamed protein product [Lupinus luteus]|uniref:Uncharacterized protein n=1 Tax=Lupinus luteus TaxID=3873 RepID=A0AAV1YA74_LUPLU
MSRTLIRWHRAVCESASAFDLGMNAWQILIDDVHNHLVDGMTASILSCTGESSAG